MSNNLKNLMDMYEARQNKEKVSRRIDGGGTGNKNIRTIVCQFMYRLINWNQIRNNITQKITLQVINEIADANNSYNLVVIKNALKQNIQHYIEGITLIGSSKPLKKEHFQTDDNYILEGMLMQRIVDLTKDMAQYSSSSRTNVERHISQLIDHVFGNATEATVSSGIHSEHTHIHHSDPYRIRGARGYGFIQDISNKSQNLRYQGISYASSIFPPQMTKDTLKALLYYHYMVDNLNEKELAIDRDNRVIVKLMINTPNAQNSGTVYPYIEGTEKR